MNLFYTSSCSTYGYRHNHIVKYSLTFHISLILDEMRTMQRQNDYYVFLVSVLYLYVDLLYIVRLYPTRFWFPYQQIHHLFSRMLKFCRLIQMKILWLILYLLTPQSLSYLKLKLYPLCKI